MANYLCVFAASDSHVDFIAAHPETLFAYVDGLRPIIETAKPTLWQRITGKNPRPEAAQSIPDDWPTTEATMIGPEINHRNADLFHLILNGTPEFVTGSGSIFQTWLQSRGNRTHCAIDLTGDNEHFAFHSHQLGELLELLSRVDEATVKSRFAQWLRIKREKYEPADAECAEIAAEFMQFASATRDAVNNGQGLVWIFS